MKTYFYSKNELNKHLNNMGLISIDLAKLIKIHGYNTCFPMFAVLKSDRDLYIFGTEDINNSKAILIPSYNEMNHFISEKFGFYIKQSEDTRFIELRDNKFHDKITELFYSEDDKFESIDKFVINYITNITSPYSKYLDAKHHQEELKSQYIESVKHTKFLYGEYMIDKFRNEMNNGSKFYCEISGHRFNIISFDEVCDHCIPNIDIECDIKIKVTVKTSSNEIKKKFISIKLVKLVVDDIDENTEYEF